MPTYLDSSPNGITGNLFLAFANESILTANFLSQNDRNVAILLAKSGFMLKVLLKESVGIILHRKKVFDQLTNSNSMNTSSIKAYSALDPKKENIYFTYGNRVS